MPFYIHQTVDVPLKYSMRNVSLQLALAVRRNSCSVLLSDPRRHIQRELAVTQCQTIARALSHQRRANVHNCGAGAAWSLPKAGDTAWSAAAKTSAARRKSFDGVCKRPSGDLHTDILYIYTLIAANERQQLFM